MEHVLTAFVTLAVSVIIFEIYAWLPSVRCWLTRVAVRLAPKQMRRRLEKEWLADLEAMPNSIAMIATSAGFFFAAIKLRVPYLNRKLMAFMTRYIFAPILDSYTYSSLLLTIT